VDQVGLAGRGRPTSPTSPWLRACYVVPKPPKGWLKNAKCPKFEHLATITPKWYEIGCQLLLVTNRKSHTGFRLVMTLNDLERCDSPYFAFFFTEFDSFTVYSPIMSQSLKIDL